MELTNEFSVAAPVDQAWAVLLDVERIAPCMPGATLNSFDGEAFTGTVQVKLGPVNMTYAGKGSFVSKDAENHQVVIQASGKDSRGKGTAAATVTASLHPDGSGTRVNVVTKLNITGAAAQFGRGMIADVAGRLINQFATCLTTTMATSAIVTNPTADPAAGLNAGPTADSAADSVAGRTTDSAAISTADPTADSVATGESAANSASGAERAADSVSGAERMVGSASVVERAADSALGAERAAGSGSGAERAADSALDAERVVDSAASDSSASSVGPAASAGSAAAAGSSVTGKAAAGGKFAAASKPVVEPIDLLAVSGVKRFVPYVLAALAVIVIAIVLINVLA
jgi:carbon monoxide dehydrogenase subunit G